MANKQKQQPKRRLSKRQRRNRLIVYIMVIAMLLSTFTAGLAAFI